MASAMRGSRTPSPSPSDIRTPPAPRLGFHDDWQPYAPRKSARLANRTPSPQAPRRQAGSPQPTKSIASAVKNSLSSSMMSPIPSPRKRRQPHDSNSDRRVSGSLTAESTSSAAALLGLDSSTPRKTTSRTNFSQEHGMLPTPSKTPSKPPTKEGVKGLQSFARNLFQSEEDVMPNNKKRAPKKYSGMTLDSFTAEAADDSIEIFTDSRERLPERDESAENPFYGETVAEPTKRRSKRRNVSVPGEKAHTVEEASERQDGMVYVFRGKRFFRKFAPEMDAAEPAADNDVPSSFSRTAIKPRLLFPVQKTAQPTVDDVDEEATTDIEDAIETDLEEEAVPQTPVKSQPKGMNTPSAPKFAPMSPPDTKRTTRSTNKLFEEATPIKKKERRSPFDTWPRTKDRKETGTKREAEPMFAPAKRTKA